MRIEDWDPSECHVLTDEEFAKMREALQDPEFFKRLIADSKAQDMVEVDNPMHREVRPRRGLEK